MNLAALSSPPSTTGPLLVAAAAILLLDVWSAQPAAQPKSQSSSSKAPVYLSYADAKPVFEAFGERVPSPEEWPAWIAARDLETRARVAEADETSIVHWFLFGTSFRGLTPVLSKGSDPANAVRRVALVGPGLDFSDKQEGYDFYAPQTIQPFAIQDTLFRHGLGRPGNLEVATFDVSPRVNAHLKSAAARAREGAPYVLHLPLDDAVPWKPDFLDYWRRLGVATVGALAPVSTPSGLRVRVRAMNVRPGFVTAIAPHDLNITAQHLELADSERFDLIVGTNIFLYYDRWQQGLAMVSASRMLRPGGVLLSNNALVEIPSVGVRSIGYSKTLYSDRDEDGDLIVWYQKASQ